MSNEESAAPRSRAGRRRRDQPSLSLDQIVTDALALLDEEGLGALSMRRLGTRLGAAATAVYWHVSNKDELLELVVDRVYAEIEAPEADGSEDWRAAVSRHAASLRSAILRHPWIASILDDIGVAYRGPHLMRASDRMLARFEAAGFPLLEADRALSTVLAYTAGMARAEAAAAGKPDAGDTLAAAEAAAEPYPRLHALYRAYRETPPPGDDFSYGLDRVLDGLAARLA